MKKLSAIFLSIFICLLVTACCLCVVAPVQTAYAEEYSAVTAAAPAGAGSVDDPYIVDSVGSVKWISDNLAANNGFDGLYFKQTADIDFTSVTGFRPIGGGSAVTAFKGVYDGGGFAVKGLSVSAAEGDIGTAFFARLENASVENLTLDSAVVRGFLSGGNYITENAGALAAVVLNSSISNVTLKNVDIMAKTNVGALAGSVTDTHIDGVRASGSVKAVSADNKSVAGGLVGYYTLNFNTDKSTATQYNVANSYSIASVSTSETNAANAGGLFGYINQTAAVGTNYNRLYISYSYFAGKLTVGADSFGAIAGNNINDIGSVTLAYCLYLSTAASDYAGQPVELKVYPGVKVDIGYNAARALNEFELSSMSVIQSYSWSLTDWVINSEVSDKTDFGSYPDLASRYDTVKVTVRKGSASSPQEAVKSEVNLTGTVAVIRGNFVNFEFTPPVGNNLASVTIGGTDYKINRNTVTFTADAGLSEYLDLYYTFAPVKLSVGVYTSGGDSTCRVNLSQSTDIAYGSVIDINIVSGSNYKFKSITVTSGSGAAVKPEVVKHGEQYRVTVTDSLSVNVVWEKVEIKFSAKSNYAARATIETSVDGGYSFSAENNNVTLYAGDTVYVKVTPSESAYFTKYNLLKNGVVYMSGISSSDASVTDYGTYKVVAITLPSDRNCTSYGFEAIMDNVLEVSLTVTLPEGEDASAFTVITSGLIFKIDDGVLTDWSGKNLENGTYLIKQNNTFDLDCTFDTAQYSLNVYKNKVLQSGSALRAENAGTTFELIFVERQYTVSVSAAIDAADFRFSTDGETFSKLSGNSFSGTNGQVVYVAVRVKAGKFDHWSLNDASGMPVDLGTPVEKQITETVNGTPVTSTYLVFTTTLTQNIYLYANTINQCAVIITDIIGSEGGEAYISKINGVDVSKEKLSSVQVDENSTVQIIARIRDHYTLDVSSISGDYTVYKDTSGDVPYMVYTITYNSIKNSITTVKLPVKPTEYSVSLYTNIAGAGTVTFTSTSGAKLYYGSVINLVAKPNNGYVFKYFTISDATGTYNVSSATYAHTVTGNDQVTACFEENLAATERYYVTVVTGTGIKGYYGVDEYYVKDEIVTLTAILEQGYAFSGSVIDAEGGWFIDGKCVSTNLTYSFNIRNDTVVEVVAVPQTFTVNYTNDDQIYRISSNSLKEEFNLGDQVTFTVEMFNNYIFDGWYINGVKAPASGDTLTIKISSDVDITVRYYEKIDISDIQVANKFDISVSTNNSAYGSARASKSTAVMGDTVTITAIAGKDYEFLYWLKDGVQVSDKSSYTATIDSDSNFVAVFKPVTRTITYSVSNAEGGTYTGATTTDNGSIESVAITSNMGYKIASIIVNGEVIEVNQKSYNLDIEALSDKNITINYEKVGLTGVELGLLLGVIFVLCLFVVAIVIVMRAKPNAAIRKMIDNIKSENYKKQMQRRVAGVGATPAGTVSGIGATPGSFVRPAAPASPVGSDLDRPLNKPNLNDDDDDYDDDDDGDDDDGYDDKDDDPYDDD